MLIELYFQVTSVECPGVEWDSGQVGYMIV